MSDSQAYFVTEGGEEPTQPGRFVNLDDIDPMQLAPGLVFRPALGEQVLVNHVFFDANTVAPTHSHVEEQIVVVLSGELEFTVGDETRLMKPGDMAFIPPWVPHGARTLDQPCVEIDIFNPPRRQLLQHLRRTAEENVR
jgi:quercetin dioxygenase-like cupin family protein